MSYLLNGAGSAIKPSVSFISMGRAEYKQHIYTDTADGPSPQQLLGNEPSAKDRSMGADNVFEVERKSHTNDLPVKTHILDDVKQMLYTNYGEYTIDQPKKLLSSPGEKRKEVRIAKEKLE